ncbi:MAG: DsbA family protein [bacterium JZ-2024 1]
MKKISLLFLVFFALSSCDVEVLKQIARELTLIRMALERTGLKEMQKLRQELEAVKKELAGLKEGKQAEREKIVQIKIKPHDPILGNPSAKLVLVEFSDFQCPYCGRFFSQTYPVLKKKYVETGKVKMVFKDLPLPFHPAAFPAALAGQCALEQGKFWEMHDRIFYNQSLLTSKDTAVLHSFASAIGLNMAQFRRCMDTEKYKKEVQEDTAEANALGFTGTPTFVLGKEISPGVVEGKIVVGAQPTQTFEAEIDSLLEK